jgi:hypothetical protein
MRGDIGSYVLNSPGSYFGGYFDRLRKAAGFNAVPPAGFLDRDDGRDGRLRFAITNDLAKPQESSFRKLVHLHLSLFKLRQMHPLPFEDKKGRMRV